MRGQVRPARSDRGVPFGCVLLRHEDTAAGTCSESLFAGRVFPDDGDTADVPGVEFDPRGSFHDSADSDVVQDVIEDAFDYRLRVERVRDRHQLLTVRPQ